MTSKPDADLVLTRDIAYTRGDRLLLVTDGVTDQIGEAMPPRAWGYRRLQAMWN